MCVCIECKNTNHACTSVIRACKSSVSKNVPHDIMSTTISKRKLYVWCDLGEQISHVPEKQSYVYLYCKPLYDSTLLFCGLKDRILCPSLGLFIQKDNPA